MVWFTGTRSNLFWFVYTPRFLGATLIGGVIAYIIITRLKRITRFQQTIQLFWKGESE